MRTTLTKALAAMLLVGTTATVSAIGSASPVSAVDTPLALLSSGVSFGTSTIGTPDSGVVTIRNTGSTSIGPLTLTGGTPTGAQFTLTSTTCTGATLAANATCSVTYGFTPTAVGARLATSSFTLGGEDFTVHLGGYGAAVTGTIQGTITMVNALPGATRNVYVTAIDGSTKLQFFSQPASYSVAVPPGTYCVSFGVGPWDGTLSSYPGKRHCRDGITPVTVTSGATVTGIDATLVYGSISGTVRDHTGTLVPSARVLAQASLGSDGDDRTANGSGAFTLGNLAPGTYCVRVSGSPTNDAADGACPAGRRRVEVAAGASVTGVDITLAAPGADDSFSGGIGGRVADGSNAPVAGRTVVAEGISVPAFGSSATTAADGTYLISGLPAGTYCVSVTDDGSALAGEVYVNATSCGSATSVTVGTTTTAGINFVLGPGATISGTIRDPSGSPTSFAQVEARKVGTFFGVTVSAGAGGAYSITGLSPGNYCVRATHSFGDYPARTHGGGWSCERDVTPVAVTGTTTVSGIDVQFGEGGRIAGTVTFPPGFVPGDGVGRLLLSARDDDGEFRGYWYPDIAGRFESDGLAPGTYCMGARAPSPSLLVTRDVGAGGASSCDTARITVVDGATTTVDFAMSLGGSVSGWVVGPDGWPDDDPSPRVEPDAGESDRVRPDGSFLLTGVPAGTYCTSVNGFGLWLLDRVYGGGVSCDGGFTPVAVTAGANSAGVHLTLATGGRIEGTVTRSGGDGYDLVELRRIDAAQPTITTNTYPISDTQAEYSDLVPPGTYCVLVRPAPTTGNANRAYGGTPSCVGATPVVVPDRTTVGAIDITLTEQIYRSLANPARLLDTRPGEPVAPGATTGGGPITGGTTREIPIGGIAGIPTDAASVAMNVTATNTTGPGFLAIYPCGQSVPTASNVNYTAAGQTTPNAVIAKLGTDAKICVYALTTTDVIIDVAGYYPDADGFTPLTNPARLLDTRPGEPVAPGATTGGGPITGGTTREIPIGGIAGIPTDAASVAMNVTATNTTGPGFLAIYPCGQSVPTASNVNYTAAGQTTPNAVIAKLGTDAKICVYALTTTDVIIDVAGYYPDADGFTPLTNPARLLDTRPGEPVAPGATTGGGPITGGTTREIPIGGIAGIPTDAASVAMNVTATNTTGPGFLAIYPCGQSVPTASNVNYTAAGQTRPNAVTARLGTDAKICVYALTTTDVIIDVAGFLPEGDGPGGLAQG